MKAKSVFTTIKTNLQKNRVAQLQLTVIVLTLILYIFFLVYQQAIMEIGLIRKQILIVDIIMAVGLIIEILYFGWEVYKYKQQEENKEGHKPESV